MKKVVPIREGINPDLIPTDPGTLERLRIIDGELSLQTVLSRIDEAIDCLMVAASEARRTSKDYERRRAEIERKASGK